jgi:hypothetical protein
MSPVARRSPGRCFSPRRRPQRSTFRRRGPGASMVAFKPAGFVCSAIDVINGQPRCIRLESTISAWSRWWTRPRPTASVATGRASWRSGELSLIEDPICSAGGHRLHLLDTSVDARHHPGWAEALSAECRTCPARVRSRCWPCPWWLMASAMPSSTQRGPARTVQRAPTRDVAGAESPTAGEVSLVIRPSTLLITFSFRVMDRGPARCHATAAKPNRHARIW